MRFSRVLILWCSIPLLWSISACGLLKPSQDGSSPERAIVLDTLELDFSSVPEAPYQIPPDITIDVQHLELDVRFNWAKQEVIGKAKVSLTAYAESRSEIALDARGFEIKSISYAIDDTMYTPAYSYDKKQILITPALPLDTNEVAMLLIDYIARPASLEHTEGTAITSDQGLYFINPTGEGDKPMQIWTQGEPECNSAWFPSVDHPHEKLTHEIFITVDSSFQTISNGRLVYSEIHNDGTRTDYWKQEKPHANYLVMMAIGQFALVKDAWRDIPVWYYLDHDYEKDAMAIFGNTPEMLEFYSNILNYEYPWAKYHQVVVKDFVSGAMENTSAVIHGDFVQLTERELLDESHEDVIAHELFHHWFGDLVTCESWSQLTLNEGFATYGEYLWVNYKYGLDQAQLHLKNDLDAYLLEASGEAKPLIRNCYHTPDDIFDNHTYQKGGRVLHMLRGEVGDAAFFRGLSQYLRLNEFQSVELSDLKKAMEASSGKNLTWFFDQWFLQEGHPQVSISYDVSPKSLTVFVEQGQSNNWPTYKINIPVVIGYESGNIDTVRGFIESRFDTLSFSTNEKPLWYAADLSHDILWEKTEEKPIEIWEQQLLNSPSSIGRELAMDKLLDLDETVAFKHANRLLEDDFWKMRVYGLELLRLQSEWSESVKAQIIELTQLDRKSAVRAYAYEVLDSLSSGTENFSVLYAYGLRDSSYRVLRNCIAILTERDPCFGADQVTNLEDVESGRLANWISRLYATCPNINHLEFFKEKSQSLDGFEVYMLNTDFKEFAIGLNQEAVFDQLAESMVQSFNSKPNWWAGSSALRGIDVTLQYYEGQINRIESSPESTLNEIEKLAELRNKKANLSRIHEELLAIHQERPSPFKQ